MAAVFAGAARAPFTAILIVFEMTDDYRMIVPLMAAVVTSLVIAERLMKESRYTLKLSRRGIRIQRGRDVDVMESVRVEEVMVKEPIIVSTDMPITMLAEKFIETGRHGFPVLDEEGKLFGVVSLADYRNAVSANEEGVGDLKVRDIASRNIITVHPDETVGAALRRMAPRDISRLPVVSRENPHELLGMVRRNDIVRAYEVGATRQEEGRLRTSQSHIKEVSGFGTIEMRIEPGSVSAGKKISEIPWPPEAVIVSIKRGKRFIIPRGNLVLEAGDHISLLSERNVNSEVRKLCLASENKE
jgi:CIC family chloride channel protein